MSGFLSSFCLQRFSRLFQMWLALITMLLGGGLGFGATALSDQLLEILVEDRDRLHFNIDSLGFEVFVGNRSQLWGDAFHAQAQ